METIKKTIEVHAPLGDVYSQWTRFEEFPKFMDGIEEVKQLDEKHLHWVAQMAGEKKEWDAEIVEHVPDDHITWRSTSGTSNGGTVFFRPKDAKHTVIALQMNYEPSNAMEKTASALGLLSKRIEGDLERFRDLVETRLATRRSEEAPLERDYDASGKSGLC
jgi:uncharacterized membrane protein